MLQLIHKLFQAAAFCRSFNVVLVMVLAAFQLKAQPVCPSHLIYYPGSAGAGNTIMGYDPSLPLSATNPINTGIPNPLMASLALLPNINGGAFSPTFYSILNGNYHYWNGITWIDTGHSTGNVNAINIGGCGSFIFNLAAGNPSSIYGYNGSGPGYLITNVPTGASADVVVDCDCNFYIFNASTPNQVLTKYSPAGVVLATYTLIR